MTHQPDTANDHMLTAAQLDDKYNPDGDGEHPQITRAAWRAAVANDETLTGYWAWVQHLLVSAQQDTSEAPVAVTTLDKLVAAKNARPNMREKYGKLAGVNWGTAVIDREDWIDPKKKYRTRRGYRVTGLHIQLHASTGQEVTFPVKGSIIVREAAPGKEELTTYFIWTLDGRSHVVGHSDQDDLVPDDNEE